MPRRLCAKPLAKPPRPRSRARSVEVVEDCGGVFGNAGAQVCIEGCERLSAVIADKGAGRRASRHSGLRWQVRRSQSRQCALASTGLQRRHESPKSSLRSQVTTSGGTDFRPFGGARENRCPRTLSFAPYSSWPPRREAARAQTRVRSAKASPAKSQPVLRLLG